GPEAPGRGDEVVGRAKAAAAGGEERLEERRDELAGDAVRAAAGRAAGREARGVDDLGPRPRTGEDDRRLGRLIAADGARARRRRGLGGRRIEARRAHLAVAADVLGKERRLLGDGRKARRQAPALGAGGGAAGPGHDLARALDERVGSAEAAGAG